MNITEFQKSRFGLFIHWGIYSIPARGEWVRSNEEMKEEDYIPFANEFDPDLFDPHQWAKLAKKAGMKYAVMTAKHHDGYCMFDTKTTDWKANHDYVREIIYAFLTIFLYLLKCPQSLILSALRAFCFCGKPHISRSIFLYFRYQAWLKSW